ncbi:membrane protein [Streptococcus macacae NCTC 11558]|uniref:Uncharacterized protein n=2 Tax=Streptococcus macacae TaxID=1339 RepID=G5JVS1_9STRE|nr:hypothetical protein STRMA_0927 [Streptococcus macacae NCTC 11558]SUN78737.1 membrane protein [Streptococcus macacae NCTC 11558]
MFNPFTGKDEPIHKHEQDRVAKYLVEHYELANGDKIKTVEVTEFQKNDMTGFWRITTKVNNKYYISFSKKQIGDELEGEGYYPNEIKDRSESSQDSNMRNVKVIYLKE